MLSADIEALDERFKSQSYGEDFEVCECNWKLFEKNPFEIIFMVG